MDNYTAYKCGGSHLDKKHYVILSRPALFDVCLSISS
ncbi:hypothetical protein C359_01503, partial [Cryptococcus neoformans Bt120]